MRAGEALEAAHKVAGAACGQIVFMIVKQRASRSTMEWAAGELERAAEIIRSSLTSAQAQSYPETSPAAEEQSTT